MSLKRILVPFTGLVAVVVVVVSAVVAPASAGTATITLSGRVSCTSSNVEGVWLEVGSGTPGASGWAHMGNTGGTVRSTTWSRTFTTALATNIRLHVGCGGSPSSWWSDNRTPSSSRTIGAIIGSTTGINARCNEGWGKWGANNAKPPASDNERCSWGRRGKDASGYPFTNAVCTSTGVVGGYCGSGVWTISGSYKDYTFSPTWFYYYRNCTDYVAYWEFFQNLGTNVFHGDASQWGGESVPGWSYTHTPHLGDIAWWSSNHVAVVTTLLSNGSVAIEEFNTPANYGTDNVRVGVIPTAYLHRN